MAILRKPGTSYPPVCDAMGDLTTVLGVNVRAKYPFLVEVGKAGFADARTDFSSFFETDEIEIPALIVGGAKREERELKYSARTKLNVVQLPFERIPSSD